MSAERADGLPRVTRRVAIAGAAALAAGLPTLTFAQRATPTDSPDAYARPELLVEPAWLADRRETSDLVTVAFGPPDEAEGERIPGALPIDWPELEVTDTSAASLDAWRDTVETRIGDLGITPDNTVVVYDTGTLFAARLWWVLHWLGHERIHILDGGLAAWKAAGFETQSGPIDRTQIKLPSYAGQPRDGALATVDEVIAALDDPDTNIVDARTPDEFAEGHIPGAVNINYPRNAESERPKRYRPAEELFALYTDAGVTPDTRVIPYCSTGVRSAVTFFALHLLGYEVSLFTGSWAEWSADPDTPKATGS